MAKLGEVCTIVSGSTPKTSVTSYWDGNIKWITPAELNEDTFYIMDSVRHITEEGKEKTGLSYLPTGTVILSSRAPIGKTAIAGCKMCCNQGFKNLICSDAIYNEYLYFFLKSKTDYLNSLGRGATFKEISKSIVENIEIPLPEVNQQKEIAEKFKKLEQLISLRKQQLAKLDELVKARFVEMFGEPVSNPYKFEVRSLQNMLDDGIITYHLDGNHGSDYPRNEEFVESGVSYISANCIIDDTVNLNLAKHLTEERAAKLRKGIAQDEDVLFAHNATVGPVAILHTRETKVILGTSLTAYRCNKQRILPAYLKAYMQSEGFVRQYTKDMKQTTRNQVPITAQRKYLFIVPPLSLQNQFAAFVERVDQQKQTVQQSLEKLELMKKALMQEYFG